jgi:hypothetical protein
MDSTTTSKSITKRIPFQAVAIILCREIISPILSSIRT